MNWHLICRAGEGDDFLPAGLKPTDARLIVPFDESENSPQAANNVLREIGEHGLGLDDSLLDLLHLAMTVYTGDLRIE